MLKTENQLPPKVKIGIIGVGNMGKNHLRILSELPDVATLVGVYDVDPARVRALGYQGEIFSSTAALLAAVDAVVIAAPSALHKQLAMEAAAAQVHLLVEKPLALSMAEATHIAQRYENQDKVLMVGHVERFNPIISELEKILQQEEILSVAMQRCSPMDRHINDADVLFDLMIHDLDILLNAIAPNVTLASCYALGRRVYSPKNCDFAQGLLQFENGLIASVTASRITENKVRHIALHCRGCFINADLLNRTLTISRKTNYTLDTGYQPIYRQENIIEQVFVPNVEPLKAELRHFIQCIQTRCSSITSAQTALRSLAVLEQIQTQVYANL